MRLCARRRMDRSDGGAAMSSAETVSVGIQQLLLRLSHAAKRNLLAEVERLQLYSEDGLPGAELILKELRAEIPDTDNFERPDNPAHYFFQPLRCVLISRLAEHANPGQISRGSLFPIWGWMSQKMLPTMARDYMEQMRRELAADNKPKAARIAAAFQSKVLKSVEGILSSDERVVHARAGLALYTCSPAAVDDLAKMAAVLRARETLPKFQEALPPAIARFEGKAAAKVRVHLDRLAAKSPEAVPFALTMLGSRLEVPWQMMRLATEMATGKAMADIAATPYAIAVPMVLDQIDERRLHMRKLLRSRRIPAAAEILASIYDIEHALRSRIDLPRDSEWGRRLDRSMRQVAAMVDDEIKSIPDETQHILASRKLRRHETLCGRITSLASQGRDALIGIAGRKRVPGW
jgi:hypothetical protein